MGMDKMRAWKLLEDISFVRLGGSEEELKAANILKDFCEAAGVPAVIEDFEVDVVKINKATLEVLEPEYRAFPVIGIGKTANTPEEGVVGGFKYIEDAKDTNLLDVEGKIVLLQGRVLPELIEKLEKKGALGYISLGGVMHEEESIKNEMRPMNAFGKGFSLPGVRIHISEAEQLVRMKPAKVRLVLDNEKTKASSHNVVATIEGTDLKDEIVAFSAHFDSVPYSKGSYDNGTGSVAIAELMHYFKEKGTRRTLKFVWCGSEEIGLLGSKAFCKAHKDELENYIFNINFDMTGVTIGYEHCCCSTSEETMHAIEFLAKLNSYPVKMDLGVYSSDSTSFAGAGVPACTFARLQTQGGAQVHNHNDTMDRLDPDSFMITQEFAAKFADMVVNAPINPIPRKLAPKVIEKLEEMKKRLAAFETEDEKKEEKKPEEKKESDEAKK